MLSDLPFELISHIAECLPTARSLLHLSLTCQRLHEYVEKEGYRVFVQCRFPSQPTPPIWKEAAHALTTLARNWDRKAFLARSLDPPVSMLRLPGSGRGGRTASQRRPIGQTMGFQPVIDSYEEWMGKEWAARREVLAWGGGAELVVRVRVMGKAAEERWEHAKNDERSLTYNQHHHQFKWFAYREPWYADGRDDITSLNLLRPSQRAVGSTSATNEDIVVGRASGSLNSVTISPQRLQNIVKTRYTTEDRSVRAADVSSSSSPLLAACLSDTAVCVYPISNDSPTIDPIAELTVIPAGKHGRTWSTRFLSPDYLAIGLGPSLNPVHIYQTTPDGVTHEPVRKFGAADVNLATIGDDQLDTGGNSSSDSSSVYSIAAVPPSSSAGGNVGDLLLSGWYDGAIRLHDMRSPSSCVQTYKDPIDPFSAIYSLQPLGRERFVAGGARHAIIKVFDFRISGGKAYYYTDVHGCNSKLSSRKPPTPAPRTSGTCCEWHFENRYNRRNWNIFLNPSGPASYRMGSRRTSESPVYSLSAPSATSTALYAGIENNVVQLDIVSMMDQHPDPVFKYGPKRTGNVDSDIKRKWDPQGDVTRLAMYEQVPMGAMRLRVQSEVGDFEGGVPGWDDRWCDGR
ncbi:MAG: hypothetical protein M1835_004162 [Candelina submexicana]|nr:MAG: hypothetical protein M1835_004162 [Candelina submexicana]